MRMYVLPQEIEVWYIIPAIRRELAGLLTEEHKMSYDKAGKVLGISKAAISQYNRNKRASKIILNKRVLQEIAKSGKILSKDGEKTVKEMLRILKFMREKKIPFEFCSDGRQSKEECKEITVAYEKYWDC